MATQIVNLNELVGEDIVFRYGEPAVDYRIPGDIDTETVFDLFEKYQAATKIEGDDPAQLQAEVKAGFDAITGKLLELLQIRQPKLTKYPFGIRGTGVVLRQVLSSLGIQITPTANPPAPNRATRRKSGSAKKTTARRR